MVSNFFGEVLVFLVVVFFVFVVFIVLLWCLYVWCFFFVLWVLVVVVMVVYVVGIVGNIVFLIYFDVLQMGELWIFVVVLILFVDYEIDDVVMNLLVFVFFGVFIVLLMVWFIVVKVIVVVVGMSLGIEFVQLVVQDFFLGGYIVDINDFLLNVVGGVVGYGLFVFLLCILFFGCFFEWFCW